jgi:tetratricopeptide (TPR) repeat protein
MLLSHPQHRIHVRALALIAFVLTLSMLAASELHGTTERFRPKQRPPPTTANEGFDALTLWQVLKSHRAGDLCDAIVRWQNITLPAESEVWRQIALGSAHLESGNLEQATQNLEAAEKLDVKNPIVHYFLGMSRLEQASMAIDYYDSTGMDSTQMVAQPLVPHPKLLYELAGMMELEIAVKLSKDYDTTAPLAPADWTVPLRYQLDMPMMTPTVGDLLEALGAENYVGRAHSVLGYMYLDRDSLEQAEQHMDSAAGSGIDREIGYRDLARKYRLLGREFDARRVLLKALKQPVAVPSDEFFDGNPEPVIPNFSLPPGTMLAVFRHVWRRSVQQLDLRHRTSGQCGIETALRRSRHFLDGYE